MNIRVFNADDHPMLRKGVIDLLQQADDIEWIGSASNGQEAEDKIRALNPDVAILDIEMPYQTGLEVASKLISEGSLTKFVLLTLYKDSSFFNHAMKMGIKGYLLKDSSEKEILDCIRSVYLGRPYVNPGLTHFLIDQQKTKSEVFGALSDHELNILKLIAQQKTTAEIADMLFISPKTVSNHRTNISKKLNLSGEQNGLLKWAIEQKDSLMG